MESAGTLYLCTVDILVCFRVVVLHRAASSIRPTWSSALTPCRSRTVSDSSAVLMLLSVCVPVTPAQVVLYCLFVQVCCPEWSFSRRCCLLTFLYRPGAICWCHMVPVHRHPLLADCNCLLSACATCLGICHWSARPVMVGTDPFGSHHARTQEAGSVRQLLSGNNPSPCHAMPCHAMPCHAMLCQHMWICNTLPLLPCFTTLFVS